MNITEALEKVKNGSLIRRKEKNWSWVSMETIDCCIFSGEDILADDWEVKEQTVTITKRGLREAYCKAITVGSFNGIYRDLEKNLFK